jgi:hypothetical protein
LTAGIIYTTRSEHVAEKTRTAGKEEEYSKAVAAFMLKLIIFQWSSPKLIDLATNTIKIYL